MAFNQYPDSIAVVISTGSPYTIDLGTAQPDADNQLSIYGLQIFKRGLQPTARMRIKAYIATTLIATSEDVIVGTIEDAYPDTANFYGWVRFTFEPRMNFNSTGTETRFQLELSNYAFTADTVFIGTVLDWPVTMGYNQAPGSVNSSPMAIELYGAI